MNFKYNNKAAKLAQSMNEMQEMINAFQPTPLKVEVSIETINEKTQKVLDYFASNECKERLIKDSKQRKDI